MFLQIKNRILGRGTSCAKARWEDYILACWKMLIMLGGTAKMISTCTHCANIAMFTTSIHSGQATSVLIGWYLCWLAFLLSIIPRQNCVGDYVGNINIGFVNFGKESGISPNGLIYHLPLLMVSLPLQKIRHLLHRDNCHSSLSSSLPVMFLCQVCNSIILILDKQLHHLKDVDVSYTNVL